MRILFPLTGSGNFENHAIVRPRTAAAFALILASACHDVGLALPQSVKDSEIGLVVFDWDCARYKGDHRSRAYVQVDAEGEVIFCLTEGGDALQTFEPGTAAESLSLRDCLIYVKAFLAKST